MTCNQKLEGEKGLAMEISAGRTFEAKGTANDSL